MLGWSETYQFWQQNSPTAICSICHFYFVCIYMSFSWRSETEWGLWQWISGGIFALRYKMKILFCINKILLKMPNYVFPITQIWRKNVIGLANNACYIFTKHSIDRKALLAADCVVSISFRQESGARSRLPGGTSTNTYISYTIIKTRHQSLL